jgi:hypothetical protein
MKTIEQNLSATEVEGRSIRSVVALRPVADLLPTISPIRDLLESTTELERSNRIYSAISVGAVLIFTASVVVGFIGYIGVF